MVFAYPAQLSGAEASGLGRHKSGDTHPALQTFQKDHLNNLRRQFDQKAADLESMGLTKQQARIEAGKFIEPKVMGFQNFLKEGLVPHLNASGNLASPGIGAGGTTYIPTHASDPFFLQQPESVGGMHNYFDQIDWAHIENSAAYKAGAAGLAINSKHYLPEPASSSAEQAQHFADRAEFRSKHFDEAAKVTSGIENGSWTQAQILEDAQDHVNGDDASTSHTGIDWSKFKFAVAGTALGALGPVGDALDFGIASAQAKALHDAGDDIGAIGRMVEWAGGFATGAGAGAGAGFYACGGGAAAWACIATVLGGGLVGGIVGEAAVGQAYDYLADAFGFTSENLVEGLTPSQLPNVTEHEDSVDFSGNDDVVRQSVEGHSDGSATLRYFDRNGNFVRGER